jgi:hypothetical protein
MAKFNVQDLILQSNQIYRGYSKSIVNKSNEIESELLNCLNLNGVRGELITVGSTGRNTFINEGYNSHLSPIDLDYYFVVDDDVCKKQLRGIEKSLNCYEKFNSFFGPSVVNYVRDKIKVSIGILNSSEVDNNDAIIYSQKCPKFCEEELEQIRAFKLFSQRCGIYSGFNKSLKGILLEQLILRYGCFQESLEKLANSFENGQDLNVKNYSSQDLISNISQVCRQRVILAAEIKLNNNVPKVPLNIDTWQELNPYSHNYKIMINNVKVDNTRHKLNSILNQTFNTQKIKYDIYSVESSRSENQVYISLKDISKIELKIVLNEINKYNLKKKINKL